MIIVLKQHAPDEKVKAFCNELQTMGYQINDSMGSDTHILGLIGDTKALSESWVLANPVVETCRRVSEPYKKANRKFHPDDTVVEVGDKKIKVGGGHFAVMAGPCSVESKEQITFVAQRVQAAGASILRGGAFKPRTSPYSFQGLRAEGLELLAHARSQTEWRAILAQMPESVAELGLIHREVLWQIDSCMHSCQRRWPPNTHDPSLVERALWTWIHSSRKTLHPALAPEPGPADTAAPHSV